MNVKPAIAFWCALLMTALMLPATAFAADPLRILSAENFYGDLASQIGGEHVQVTNILSNPDEDPHLFETSASTARAVADASIVIYNGADYDPWMDDLLKASPRQGRAVIVAADLVGARSGDNPHVWYKPDTFPAVAKALEAELEKRDPGHAADFKANLAKFNQSMAEIGKKVAAIRSAHAGVEVTATEPVFGYMAEAMGLTVLNTGFQSAVMNEAEPSPSQVAAFETSLSDGSAKILFYNAQVTDDATTRLLNIAKTHRVKVIGVTETEPAGKTIQTWFEGQVDEVSGALAR